MYIFKNESQVLIYDTYMFIIINVYIYLLPVCCIYYFLFYFIILNISIVLAYFIICNSMYTCIILRGHLYTI